jgi:hypothetical protein
MQLFYLKEKREPLLVDDLNDSRIIFFPPDTSVMLFSNLHFKYFLPLPKSLPRRGRDFENKLISLSPSPAGEGLG